MRRADPDIWGYLAYGRLFVEHGGPVSQDPFAYTSSGYDWVAFEYLAQILFWEAYHLAGPLGLMALKCIVGGVAVYLIHFSIRATSDDPLVWIPAFLFATATVSRYFLFRPQLFTFAFFALYTAVLIRFLLGSSRGLWVLPIAMLAWANLHGGFLAGLGLLCVALALRICRNANASGVGPRLLAGTKCLWVTLVASCAVTLINPHGWRLWSYVLTEILHGTNRRYISEWRPAVQSGDYWTTASLILLAAGLGIVGWLGHRRLPPLAGLRPWQWVLACGPLALMAFWSVRHVPIATIWITPIVSMLASSLKAQSTGRAMAQRRWVLAGAVACVPAVLTCSVVSVRPLPRIEISGNTLGPRHPCTSAVFMRQSQLTGNVYTPLWWGSYLTWQLYPGVKVSMDGRNISAFPDAVVVENLRFYSDNPTSDDLEAPFRYETDFLLTPSDRPVLRRILADSRWRTVFADSDSVLFVRADQKPLPMVVASGDGRLETLGSACPDFLQ